jgi:CRISPR system Cascade subunit CasE
VPYLSRLLLDPISPRVLAELASVAEMHRTVMRAFPGPRAGNRVLFRVDQETATGRPQVLVQSLQQADWSFLETMPSYLYRPPEAPLVNPAQKPFRLGMRQGEVLAFRLRANPTFRRGRRRLGWLGREQQLRWLSARGDRGGFEPEVVQVASEGSVWTRKRVGEASTSLCFRSVLFTGLLRVTCPALLALTVARGLGSGKAYGFGLLSLSPPG